MIATSKRVDISGVDQKALEKASAPEYFTKEKSQEKKSEEAFFQQGEKAEVRLSCSRENGRIPWGNGMLILEPLKQKKKVASDRANDQKAIDQTILASVKKENFLGSYLATTFSLRNGDKPHEMKW